ncbi:translation initiation factor IF-2 subunit alpha [Candidatus Woesearchaeota archaeon CG_4_10_14_0_2_um_filter_33_13]|nr:MAG: translation initiation factor IF-2 subunit alpha [Candidatus Woesearchaeota archaeon CG_4_10_14_0_2_um_filter_33_13]
MFYKRHGIPEENEIVLCQVTKLFPNSVFVDLLEYGQSGMVHISEVSPGRIRNLRDYVSIGRQVVCKVLRIDRERGHIDLSLRRVNSNDRKEKLDSIKQELKAESIVKSVAKRINKPAEEVYKKISVPIFQEYDFLYSCFRDVAEEEADLEKMGIEKSLAQEFNNIIIEKFKPESFFINAVIHLETYKPQGIEKIKKTLQDIEKVSDKVTIAYLGGGRYKLIIEDVDYKLAENSLSKVEGILEKFNDKLSTSKLEREKKD